MPPPADAHRRRSRVDGPPAQASLAAAAATADVESDALRAQLALEPEAYDAVCAELDEYTPADG